jgi:protein associated with RNAse G/E
MKPGDKVKVNIFKADGLCYRWWEATVEAVEADCVVTTTPPGRLVEDIRGSWVGKSALRAYYWFDRPYNLIEVYHPDGIFAEIYVNIGSPAEIRDGNICFTDNELDVSLIPPQPARIVDQDDFASAAEKYCYSPEFQRKMYAAAETAVRVANAWQPKGMPNFRGETHAE